MIARCIYNSGVNLGAPQRADFYSTDTVFDLEIDTEYHVLGFGLYETVLLALICDETGKPNWLPIGLFEISSQALPDQWEFILLDGVAASGGDSANRWVAKWGYPELVRNAEHSDQLIHREPSALRIFFDELANQSSPAL